ncbi:MAG: hypothetical protein ACREMF_01030 [Gemmatimonadales bacterium]
MTSGAVAATDRSDFRSVLVGGTKVGVVTAVLVIACLAVTRLLPAGVSRDVVLSLLVLATGVLVSLLPGEWVVPRNTEGVAGTAAMGLWGTVVFMAIDIVLLRPFKAYPWTWDAIGGGSTWWYLPVWWMLGTFLAWMGGLLTAARNTPPRAPATLGQLAMPLVLGTVGLAAVSKLLGLPVAIPVLVGASYTVTLAALALLFTVRKA